MKKANYQKPELYEVMCMKKSLKIQLNNKSLSRARLLFVTYLTGLITLVQPITPVHSPVLPPEVAYASQDEIKIFAMDLARTQYGWGYKEFLCVDNIFTRESHWNPKADNPRSTAYGIAQMLGEDSKECSIQVANGFKYIEHRYDTPCNAWKFWQMNGYY